MSRQRRMFWDFRTGNCTAAFSAIGQNERGIALVMALVMLLLLGILGAMVLNSSTADLQIAANARNMAEAHYITDALVAYCTTTANLTTARMSPGANGVWVCPGPDLAVGVGAGNAAVRFLFQGDLPKGSGTDLDTKGLYFLVNVTGRGLGNSEVMIQTSVVQIP